MYGDCIADENHLSGVPGRRPFPIDFTMAFQPILDVQKGDVWGYEALVRGTNGEGAGHVLARS